jgi:Fuc2NAc and GlcNAc transferase
MTFELVVLTLACFALSALLTQAVRNRAVARGLLDVPNERSSHTQPTPRGGGVAIVAAATACFVLLAVTHRLDAALAAALAGSLPVAAIGFLDDRGTVPAGTRLAVHVATAVWAVAWLGGLPPLRFGLHVSTFAGGGFVVAVLGIAWVTNLFNFMDGVDGIAATEATFISCSGALLTAVPLGLHEVPLAAMLLGSACLGFLRWNWPPAKIFLGDVGSGYLGYAIAVLALADGRHDPIALWVWLILGGVFFIDATTTLVRRVLRGERVHQAHRSHAYQWLARRWRSHRKVTLAVLAVNLLWLLPCAVLATTLPGYAFVLVTVALAPLVLLALVIGSGRAQASSQTS